MTRSCAWRWPLVVTVAPPRPAEPAVGLSARHRGDRRGERLGQRLGRIAARKLHDLGDPIAPVPLPATDLVRIVAAAALSSHRAMRYLATPDGRRFFTDSANALGSDAKPAVHAVPGNDLLAMIPSDDQAAATTRFWLAALADAHTGEPTVARLRAAADHAPAIAHDEVTAVLRIVARLQTEISTPPPTSP